MGIKHINHARHGYGGQADNETLYRRLIANVTKPHGELGCWLWRDGKSARYGRFNLNGQPINPSRAMYILVCGTPKPGNVVRHRCDTPCCINPWHLVEGTHQDNADDRQRAGRSAGHGKRNPKAHIFQPWTTQDYLQAIHSPGES